MRSAVPRRYYSVISLIVRQSIDYRNSRRRHDVRESRSTAAAVLKARAISAAARSYRAPGARSARALADRQGRRTGYRTHTACRRRNYRHRRLLPPQSEGRSGWFSQTQPVLSQTKHAMTVRRRRAPESESGPVFRYSACHFGPRTLVLKTDGYGFLASLSDLKPSCCHLKKDCSLAFRPSRFRPAEMLVRVVIEFLSR
jgi:hypothetical protein